MLLPGHSHPHGKTSHTCPDRHSRSCAPHTSFCAANELFFIAVYLLAFFPDESTLEYRVLHGVATCTFPVMAVKAAISAVHLYSAAYNIAVIDADSRTAKRKAKSG